MADYKAGLLDRFASGETFLNLAKDLQNAKAVSIYGMSNAVPGLLVATAARYLRQPALVVCANRPQAEALICDLRFFSEQPVCDFAETELIPGENDAPQIDLADKRISALYSLLFASYDDDGGAPIVVTSLPALLPKLFSPDFLFEHIMEILVGDQVERTTLTSFLDRCGYNRADLVLTVGQYNIHGGIVDIYSPLCSAPVRLEFFDDQVESIRSFDPESQRTIAQQQKLVLTPVHEYLTAATPKHSLFDFLPDKTNLFVVDQQAVDKRWRELFPMDRELSENFYTTEELQYSLSLRNPASLYPEAPIKIWTSPPAGSHLWQTADLPHFNANLKLLGMRLGKWLEEGVRVVIVATNQGQKERLAEILAEHVAHVDQVELVLGEMGSGFFLPSCQLVVFTDNQIFNRYQQRRYYKRFHQGQSIASFLELRPGDHIVHYHYGVGIFCGLARKEIDGRKLDFLELDYASGDKLFVPISKLALLTKYIGDPDSPPKLNKLKGQAWQKSKAKVREDLLKMAKELLDLYSAREAICGFIYPAGGKMQQEFEAAFIYQETPDQLEACRAVMADMDKSRPMDRLICGDVGFGKTEVAIRATFRAVASGRQVAILVPTTILAMQHARTFQERFADFPVKLGLLTRFQSAKEQRLIKADLAEGKLDVVIGTHRLLQKDVIIPNLGLLVIDEEQRFGVRHKETMKKMRREVDVLTLSATPIPRSLNMSINNVRDISLINTPPIDRLPVATKIATYNEELVTTAIRRELLRKGQVYYVYNRVQRIEEVVYNLQRLVPEARIRFGHGQMKERELEEVILDFVNYRFDILVATTIVESGLDIPRANTLIIEDADSFGLSQLYQLRGRVGRSEHRGYAYLLYREQLTKIAARRLGALSELTELGSGILVAMKDLEIRGAGNLLGPQQHGRVAAVGFQMYCDLLHENISRLRGQVVTEELIPEINLQAECYLGDDYISNDRIKVNLYRRIAGTQNKAELKEIAVELKDRFGALPKEAEWLLRITHFSQLCRKLRLARLDDTPQAFVMRFKADTELDYDHIIAIGKSYPGMISFAPQDQYGIFLHKKSIPKGQDKLKFLETTLEKWGQTLTSK